MEAAFSDPRIRRAEGPGADPQEPPADDATGDGGAAQGAGAGASGLRVQPAGGDAVFGGRRVSSITIQKILNDNGLGTRQDRWLALERNLPTE